MIKVQDYTPQELREMARSILLSIPDEDWVISPSRKEDLLKLEAGVAAMLDAVGPLHLSFARSLVGCVEAAYLLGRRDGKSAGVLQFQVAEEEEK